MGKPHVEENLVNKYWSREQHSHDDSNNSNAESNAIQEILAKCTSPEQKKVPSKIKTKLQWSNIYKEFENIIHTQDWRNIFPI